MSSTAVPNPPTWVAADFVDAPQMNADVRDTFNFVLSPPRVKAYNSADQSTSNLVDTLYNMNSEEYDPYSPAMHDNSTNNSRLVAQELGIYTVTWQVRWSSNGTGERVVTINKNANGVVSGGTRLMDETRIGIGGGIPTVFGRAFDVLLAAGDYIEMFTRQGSGGALNVNGGVGLTYLTLRWTARQ